MYSALLSRARRNRSLHHHLKKTALPGEGSFRITVPAFLMFSVTVLAFVMITTLLLMHPDYQAFFDVSREYEPPPVVEAETSYVTINNSCYIRQDNSWNLTGCHAIIVVIPCKNCTLAIEFLVPHLHRHLQSKYIDYKIILVQQRDPGTFNLGALYNIGVLESSRIANTTCLVFHRDDLLPQNPHLLYQCSNRPKQLSPVIDDQLPFASYFGGVTAVQKEQFYTIRGFSNFIADSSGVEADFLHRCRKTGLKVSRSPLLIGRYKTIGKNFAYDAFTRGRYEYMDDSNLNSTSSFYRRLSSFNNTTHFIHLSVEISKQSNMQLCLVGNCLNPDGFLVPCTGEELMSMQVQSESETHPVENGGSWRPNNCISQRKVAVIVASPSSDFERVEHLIQSIHSTCQKQLLDYSISWLAIKGVCTKQLGLCLNAAFQREVADQKPDCISVIYASSTKHLHQNTTFYCHDNDPVTISNRTMSVPAATFTKLHGFSNANLTWPSLLLDFQNRAMKQLMHLEEKDGLHSSFLPRIKASASQYYVLFKVY